MKIKNADRKIEENGLVLKRCVSTYKQEFLSMDKTSYLKNLSSPSEIENNMSPAYNTDLNPEKICSNVQINNNNLIWDKKFNRLIINDNCDNVRSKFQNKKKRKLGNLLFQSSVRRNFSPQILKTKIDFNLNYYGKNTSKNNQNFIRTNLLNNSNENQFLINNRSTKNMNTEILSLNNSVAQNSCFKKVKSILIIF